MKKNDLLDQFYQKRKSLILRIFISVISALVLLVSFIKVQTEGSFIAKISVQGIIQDRKDLIDQIDSFTKDKNIKGLITIINSPGGTYVGSKELYDSIKAVSEKIPTVVYMKEMATSGGYLVSLASDKIYGNAGTITGSVGVILQTADISELLGKLGVKPVIVKSGEFKAVPNPAEAIDNEKLDYLQDIIKKMQDEFLDIVKTNRDISKSVIELVSDGRILTGRQAKEYKLIDDLGNEKDAIDWLKKQSGETEDIKIIDFSDKKDFSKILDLTFFKTKISYINQNFNSGFFAIWTPGL